MRILPGAILALLSIWLLAAPARAAKDISERIQSQIVKLYSEGRCADIRSLVRRLDLTRLRPNVMAIAATCDPPGYNSEDLFARAEKASPTGDLILVLHARHLFKADAAKAASVWQRVLMVARNDYFRQLAKDYLAGVIDADSSGTNEKPLDLSPSTAFAQFFFGAEHRANTELPDFVFLPGAASYGAVARGELTYRHWYRFGSLAIHYLGSYEHFFSAAQNSLWVNDLELPIAIHITTNKDIIVRPFTGYSHLGSSPLRFLYGLGMAGAVYNDTFTQSVQGIVYADRVLVGAISSEQGSHYRFQYEWEFFPKSWFFSTTAGVEHVSASTANSLFGATGSFEMSHTDLGFNGKLERDFPKFSAGFEPRLVYRVDSQDTIVFSPAQGAFVSKQRREVDLALQANLTVPLLPSLQLFAWYEWRRVFSNFGTGDFVNRNFTDQTIGAGVKTSLSTY